MTALLARYRAPVRPRLPRRRRPGRPRSADAARGAAAGAGRRRGLRPPGRRRRAGADRRARPSASTSARSAATTAWRRTTSTRCWCGWRALGRQVVRLKGGDPFVFGRGGEELQVLAAHGVAFEVVPGITAACGVASYAGIPLTHRDYAQSLPVRHRPPEGRQLQPRLAGAGAAAPDRRDLHGAERAGRHLRAADRARRRPEHAGGRGAAGHARSTQRVVAATLADLHLRVTEAGLQSPCLIIVGEVVRLHDQLAWFGEHAVGCRCRRAGRRAAGVGPFAARAARDVRALSCPTARRSTRDLRRPRCATRRRTPPLRRASSG